MGTVAVVALIAGFVVLAWPALRLGPDGRRGVRELDAARQAFVADRFGEAADRLDAALDGGAARWPARLLEVAAGLAGVTVVGGDVGRAGRQLDRVEALASGRRTARLDGTLARQRSQVLRLAGSFTAAHRELHRAREALARDGDRLPTAMVHTHAALLALDEGRHADAAAEGDAAAGLLRPRAGRGARWEAADAVLALAVAARADAARGEVAAAARRAEEMAALVDHRTPRYPAAMVPLVRSAVALAAGDAATAATAAEAARAAFLAIGAADGADAALALGRARRALGDEEAARRHLAEAVIAYRRHGWNHWLAVATAELGGPGAGRS